jgi:hypothetical protein
VEYKRTPIAFVHFMIKFREGMRAERMTMTRLSIALNTIMITYHVIYTYYELIIPLQLKDALQMFQGIVGSSFSYIHCLWMLHHEKNGMIGLHPSPRRTRKQQSQQAQLNRAWKQKKGTSFCVADGERQSKETMESRRHFFLFYHLP